MQSLVLGATGIVGGYIVRHLLLLGEKPIALSRSPPKDPGGAQWVSGDLADPTALKFPQIEIIYCTVEVGLLVASAAPPFEPISQTRGCLHLHKYCHKNGFGTRV